MERDEQPAEELDTEQLLRQGDELLRSSRALLGDLDDVVGTVDEDADPS